MTSSKTIIVISGPTAIGKTKLSIQLAKELNCPILSADSRQFFKEMSIGTAKPTLDEMGEVPHYFIDSHSILDHYNVGLFETEAMRLLEKLFQQHQHVIIVGGSGMYVDAICNGIDKLPEADPAARTKIKELLESEGIEALQQLLKELDPVYFEKVDPHNPQRLSRALEVCLSTGQPYSTLRTGNKAKRFFNILKIGLTRDREMLYDRINARVDTMMENGLLEEVKSLLPHKNLNALQTVGYKELFSYLAGETDLKTAIDLIKQNTRKFAKRQLTWFRRDEAIKWFHPEDLEEISKHLHRKLLDSNLS